jgi:excisionase family DNA binding protein
MTTGLPASDGPHADWAHKDVLTLEEAAKVLRIGVSTAKNLAAQGQLPGVLAKLGSQWRVSAPLLREYLAESPYVRAPGENTPLAS